MEFELKGQFIDLVARFKRIDICPSSSVTHLQASEMAVMIRASTRYTSPDGCAGVSEIHQTMYISKAAVSQTLNALERKGYITRAIDPSDRRKIMVTITAEGEAELEKTKQLYDNMLNTVLDQFGLEDTKTFIRLAERLMRILAEIQQD